MSSDDEKSALVVAVPPSETVPDIDQKLFQLVCEGAEFTKFHLTSSGTSRRFLQLYAEYQVIRWRKPTEPTFKPADCIKLDDIVDIAPGVYEGAFAGKQGEAHKKVIRSYAHCMTLYVRTSSSGVIRTLDLEADTDALFEAWFFGLQSLCETALVARGRALLTRTALRSIQAVLFDAQNP